MITEEIRSYEVSLWTLQDDFITVLKWSDVEQKGRIEKPKLTLNVDGTEKLNFTIPMYYHDGKELKENPIWYNTQNGNLIANLRKLKLIFNKYTEDEKVFEFVIIDVNENHEKDIVTCEVAAEGLAFQELGKIGYKISLSQENFEIINNEWLDEGEWTRRDGSTCQDQPVETIDYWCVEGCGLEPLPADLSTISSRQWYYSIQMNWEKKSEANGVFRSNDTVYEENYISSWALEQRTNDRGDPIDEYDIFPAKESFASEKARSVEIEKSNLYNITQTIAEKFGVFCRYEYLHDANYHIIGRVIVFYNNFSEEANGFISFTYPYFISKTGRKMEGADITTKLYVLDVDTDTTLDGVYSIMNTPANKSREDYILNFEYLKKIGGVSEEQYAAIADYEAMMRHYNDILIQKNQELNMQENQLPEIEAKKKIVENSIDLDNEQIYQNQALINELLEKYGDPSVDANAITLSAGNCDYCIIQTKENGTPFINLKNTNKGIIPTTIAIYKTFTTSSSGPSLSNPISNYYVHEDEYGNPDEIQFLLKSQLMNGQNMISSVYVTYSYHPCLYYQKVLDIWYEKCNKDQQDLELYNTQLGPKKGETNYSTSTGLYKIIDDLRDEIENTRIEKNAAIAAFERLMGPAIREGYWQPEDYTDYGEYKTYTAAVRAQRGLTCRTPETTVTDATEIALQLDSQLFDYEQQAYYEVGVYQTQKYYPCIDLLSVFNYNIPADLKEYSVVWNANPNSATGLTAIKDLQVFGIGSTALVQIIEYNGTYIPVLMLVGAKTLSDDQITRLMNSSTGAAHLEKYAIVDTNNDGVPEVTHNKDGVTTPIAIGNSAWIYNSPITTAYPRIRIANTNLKTDTSNLTLHYNNHLLTYMDDYYINTDNRLYSDGPSLRYFITIKPEAIIKYGSWSSNGGTTAVNNPVELHYVLSNANTSIYLDALKISEENSKPKVSYNISVNLLNRNLMRILYNKRAQIIMINDIDLKFENVFGYISQLDLDLDQPQNDTIEVKNYTTKFEDLFSTIVAQTEDMKRSSSLFSAALGGGVPLSDNGLEKTLTQNEIMLNAYLDSYFDSSEVVKNKLKDLFTEAGEILSDSNKSLESMRALTLENADILANFALDISKELTVTVYKQSTKPTKYKPGDIWIDDQGHEYVATGFSEDGGTEGTSGFVRTHDGTIASMTGASLDINADDGKISLTAANNLYLASNQVDIVGNDVVNIGGTQVNIVSLTKDGTSYNPGGINLIASGAYKSDDSYGNIGRVLISPTRIEMGAAELEFKAASQMNFITSMGSTTNTSALHVSSDDGIWIGSGTNKGVRIFSGDVTVNKTTGALVTQATGASIELNSEHLILGFMEVNKTTGTIGNVIEMTKEYMILASGSPLSGTSSDANLQITGLTPTSSNHSLVGAKFTKDFIGFATQTSNTMNAVIMNNNGVTIGSSDGGIDLANSTSTQLKTYFDNTSNADRGSYVRVAASGVEIGSLADLYVNTNNFKLQTNAAATANTLGTAVLAIGTNLNGINANTTPSSLGVSSTVTFLVNQNGAFINGYVYASGGSFTGNVTATSFSAPGLTNTQKFYADGSKFGFYDGNTGLLTLNSSGAISANGNLTIASGKTLTLNGASFSLDTSSSGTISINSSNFKVNSSPPPNGYYFYAGGGSGDNEKYIRYTQAGALEIKGSVTATNLDIITNGTSQTLDDFVDGKISGASLTVTDEQIWAGVKRATEGTSLSLTDNSINLKVTENNTTSTAFTLNSSGITMTGKHIYINGQKEWSRDDIVVMNPDATGDESWRQTVTSIERHMGDRRDWVLIKPYYNATIQLEHNKVEYYSAGGTGQGFAQAYSLAGTGTDTEPIFGNSDGDYIYDIYFTLQAPDMTAWGVKYAGIGLRLGGADTQNVNNNIYYCDTSNITADDGIYSINNGLEAEAQIGIGLSGAQSKRVYIQMTRTAKNLCQEGKTLYFYYWDKSSGNNLVISNILVIASCAGVTDRVPCAVYYYSPITSS